MACPLCKSDRFFVKDPEDEYETYEFKTQAGGVVFANPGDAENAAEIASGREVFCLRCSWHGKLDQTN